MGDGAAAATAPQASPPSARTAPAPSSNASRVSVDSVARPGRLGSYLQLLRPGNAAMAAVGGITGYVLVGGGANPALAVAATLPPFLVAGFGNVYNDIQDADLDRVAHPRRPLPSGAVTRRAALGLAMCLAAAGIVLAAAGGWAALAFATANALLLVAYECRLKAAGITGNALVGLLVASTFLYGGVVAAGRVPVQAMLWLLAGMAGLSSLARELLKDIEDRHADAGHRTSFPLRHGAPKAAILAFLLVNAAVLASIYAFLRAPHWWWTPWLPLLALADVLFVVGACLAWLDVGLAQRTLKAAMLVALVAFLAGAGLGAG